MNDETQEINYEIIDLTPDMSAVWGNILSTLRTTDHILYAACSEQADIDFGREEIHIRTNNETVYNILQRGIPIFNQLAGEGIVQIIFNKKQAIKTNKIEQLKKLFGEKLVIKN